MAGRLFCTMVLMALLIVPGTSVLAASSSFPLQSANIASHSKVSLQRGAKYFVNYCLSCHSAKHSRYIRVGEDLDIPKQAIEKFLIFTDSKVNDLMTIAMTDEESVQWFGAAPPDLSLTARSRSPDWLYTYLNSFYLDESRPLGVNNALFQNVAMPHVLWDLQGWQKPVYADAEQGEKNAFGQIVGFEKVTEGRVSEEEYQAIVRDIVAFMAYLAEPSAHERESIRDWVMLFLLIFFAVAFFLKREYWKDVH